MYFHFRSKHALAVAIIDQQVALSRAAVEEILTSRLSALETLIDMAYLLVIRDLTDTIARAALYLLEAIGRTENIQTTYIDQWVLGFTEWTRKAHADGDLLATADPADVARLVIAVNSGLRQIHDLADAEGYLRRFEAIWLQIIPGFVAPGRMEYFDRFIRRRTVVAIRKVQSC